MAPGFNLPKKTETDFYPTAASPQEALEKLRSPVARTKTKKMTANHPVLGKLTNEERTQLHLRHAELHLSFALPGTNLS